MRFSTRFVRHGMDGTLLAVVCAGMAAGSFLANRLSAEEQFPADPPMPAFSLPDPLVSSSGMAVESAKQWTDVRRHEILELFRTHVYGRVPKTSYEKSFEVTHEDRQA